MKSIQGHHLIKPEDLSWRPSNLMQIPNADFLERTGSENLGARLWRLPPQSANTLHRHVRQEEFYFVVEGTGRMRVGEKTLSVPEHGGVLVGPDQLRQVFNDTAADVLWLIVGGPEELEFLPGAATKPDMSLVYPTDPRQLPDELAGVEWPPRIDPGNEMTAIDFAVLAQEWIEAWNAHDLERILIHYADDVELVSPFVVKLTGRMDGKISGKAGLRDYFARSLQVYPTLHFELVRCYSGVRSYVLDYHSISNLRATELMEFNKQGKVLRVLAHYHERGAADGPH